MHGSAISFLLHLTDELKPGVLESLTSADTVTFFAKNAVNQVLGFIRDLSPSLTFEAVLAYADSLDNCLVSLPIEGRLTTQQDVQNDTDTPHVTLFTVTARDDLRCNIVGGTKDTVHCMLVIDSTRCSKVDQFDNCVVLVFEMDVLRLDIAVHNTVLMQVVDSREELPDYVGRLDLVEVLIGCYTLIKCSTVHHLIDEVDLLLVLVHLNDLSDVGVIQLLQEFNLFEQLAALTKLQVFFANDLDGSDNARDLVHGASHSA